MLQNEDKIDSSVGYELQHSTINIIKIDRARVQTVQLQVRDDPLLGEP